MITLLSIDYFSLVFILLFKHKPLTSNSDGVRCGRQTQISACSSHMNEIGGTKIQRTSDPGSAGCVCSSSDVVSSSLIVAISHTRETRRWRRPGKLQSPTTNLSDHYISQGTWIWNKFRVIRLVGGPGSNTFSELD